MLSCAGRQINTNSPLYLGTECTQVRKLSYATVINMPLIALKINSERLQ